MGGAMKTILVSLLTLSVLPAPAAAADKTEINGTWSGNWTPKGGVPDAVTVELRRAVGGNLTGKSLTPAPMESSKASFNPLTRILAFEATDENSAKPHKIDGKAKATER